MLPLTVECTPSPPLCTKTHSCVRNQASMQCLQKRCMHTARVRVSFKMPAVAAADNRGERRGGEREAAASAAAVPSPSSQAVGLLPLQREHWK